MGPKARVTEQDFFRQPLLEQINLKHPLVRLASLIDWARLDAAMSESFVSRAGRPATSPRLIPGGHANSSGYGHFKLLHLPVRAKQAIAADCAM